MIRGRSLIENRKSYNCWAYAAYRPVSVMCRPTWGLLPNCIKGLVYNDVQSLNTE